MFKQIVTLIRGRQHDAAEAFTDANAMALLRQQIRDAASAVEASRRAVALAMAQGEREANQRRRLEGQIADLETRTMAALTQGQEELARAAAETIAHLEAERDTAARAGEAYGTEIARLRTHLREAETRLRALERGQRLAFATDQTQRLRRQIPAAGVAAISEAEATLKRLEDRQARIEATDMALIELDGQSSAEQLREKLAAAGCGTPIRVGAEDVLARLKAKAAADKPSAA
ncbi:MAG: PspA/IM30 family protein [Tabrizicola sp.]|nr:PspA/IM30 family protein [Tabrizicola sp.]